MLKDWFCYVFHKLFLLLAMLPLPNTVPKSQGLLEGWPLREKTEKQPSLLSPLSHKSLWFPILHPPEICYFNLYLRIALWKSHTFCIELYPFKALFRGKQLFSEWGSLVFQNSLLMTLASWNRAVLKPMHHCNKYCIVILAEQEHWFTLIIECHK